MTPGAVLHEIRQLRQALHKAENGFLVQYFNDNVSLQAQKYSLSSMVKFLENIYVSLRLRVQNAVPAQPCVGKLGISLVLLNFLHCNFRLWFKTP